MSEADIRAERLKKLELLKSAGMDPYPAQSNRDTSNKEALESFDALENGGTAITIAGRVMSLRGQGGIMFADIFDGTDRLQVVLQKDDMDTVLFDLFAEAADAGDFIEVSGKLFTTQRGQQSLKAQGWRMLSKSLLPIPTEHFGIKDEEKILRERYLDILLNEETREMFHRRARFWQAIRGFYVARGFLEVETPILESMPGGADARPFVTHHNALDIDVYLRISAGELWQKKLLVAGYPKTFEIGRIFRNEGQSREHLQDYTQLESYEAFSSLKEGGDFVKELYRHIAQEVYGKYTFEINGHTVDLAEDWKVIVFSDIIKEKFGIDPLSCTEEEAIQAVRDNQIEVGEALNLPRAIDHLWKSIRKTISGPAFLVGVPVYLEPLAKKFAGDPRTVERLQVLIAGSEVGKGYSELNDPQDQQARFEGQQKLRDQGDDEAQRLDMEYIKALEYGMPPAFGFGVSERFFAFLENKPAYLGQIFPLLRPAEARAATGKSKETLSAAIVLNPELLDEEWKVLNTTAHLAASFASRQGKELLRQDTISTKDGEKLALNIQHAIMIRQASNSAQLRDLLQKARGEGLAAIPFTQEMIETTSDKKVIALTQEQRADEVRYLGALVFGEKKRVDRLTEEFQLHK